MMEGNKDSVRILGILEPPHRDQPGIEVADVAFDAIGGLWDARILEVREGKTNCFEEAIEGVELDGIYLEEVVSYETLQVATT